MRFVQFESLRPDGTTESHLIPSDKVQIIRPLNEREAVFAEKLRTGFFGEITYKPHGVYGSLNSPKTEVERALASARIYGAYTDVAHADTRSILVTTDGARFCLAKSVEEYAASVPDVIALTGSQSARPSRSAMVGNSPPDSRPAP